MEIKTTTQTKIDLSANDVKEIVTTYLKEKGFDVETYHEKIDKVYNGSLDHYGTDTFMGLTISANKTEKLVKL